MKDLKCEQGLFCEIEIATRPLAAAWCVSVQRMQENVPKPLEQPGILQSHRKNNHVQTKHMH